MKTIITIIIVLLLLGLFSLTFGSQITNFFEAAANCPGNCRENCLFSEQEHDDRGYCENNEGVPNTCCILNTSSLT